jgi:hypothetical protein
MSGLFVYFNQLTGALQKRKCGSSDFEEFGTDKFEIVAPSVSILSVFWQNHQWPLWIKM